MLRLQATILLSSMLLFVVQPMIAKTILPAYGGTAAVWTTCMMFFQIVLVLGYAYSHLLSRFFAPQRAFVVHAVVLLLAGLLTSFQPTSTPSANLTLGIVMTLLTSIGMPYFALSTTGSLVQAWHHALTVGDVTEPSLTTEESKNSRSTYRLYALSNFGSMVALVGYPFLIEPWFSVAHQSLIWSWGFWAFLLLCLWAGFPSVSLNAWTTPTDTQSSRASETNRQLSPARIIIWLLLSFCPSVVLLATTNLICQEIASVPFLWIVPLALYLISFMICFGRPTIFRRRIFGPLLMLSILGGIGVLHAHIYVSILLQIITLTSVCFCMAMVGHGELERMKPPANQLTIFYLVIAIGGACGGVFVAIIAPQLFDSFLEFQIALLLGLGLMIACIWLPQPNAKKRNAKKPSVVTQYVYSAAAMLIAAVVLASLMYQISPELRRHELYRARNEYGLASVVQVDGYRKFISGNVDHGGQFVALGRALDLSGYYGPTSGIGIAVRRSKEWMPKHTPSDKNLQAEDSQLQNCVAKSNASRKVAVVGMGVGAMLTWCGPEDQFTFYELNPLVKTIALEYFSYFKQRASQSTIHIGDGRVLLEKLLRDSGSAQFDILAMDAFSSDSIPQHLLTTECFELYLNHLAHDGIIVTHITNRFVDLKPVVMAAAQDLGLHAFVRNDSSLDSGASTLWILLCRNPQFADVPWMQELSTPISPSLEPIRWTDDFASLSSVANWRFGVDITDLQRSREQLTKSKASQP